MVSSMGRVFGKEPKEIAMQGNGEWERPMDLELIPGLMGIDIKASLSIVSSMGKELKNLRMKICIRVSILRGSLMVMGSTIGAMAATSKGISSKECDVGMGFGRKAQGIAINTRESMLMIRNTDMVFLRGQQGIFTRETMLNSRDKGMERCTGVMGAITRDSGRKGYRKDRG